jgi:hypothetical protein
MRRFIKTIPLLIVILTARWTIASTMTVTIPGTHGGAPVDGNYGMSHIFIDEIAGDSVPVTIFFDPQTNNVAEAQVYTNLNRRDMAMTVWHKHVFNVSSVEQNATRSGDSNLIVDSTADVTRGSNVTVTGTGIYDGTYRVVSVPASNKIEIPHTFTSTAAGQVSLNYEEGIVPLDGSQLVAGDDSHYYKVYPMSLVQGGYTLTLNAQKTGAYRFTARYRLVGESSTTWHYFNDFTPSGSPYPNRDFALVVSPMVARTMSMAEIDPINVNATGTLSSQRGTLADLADSSKRWNFNYATGLGVNWLWLQPIHPFGIDGRQLSAADVNNRESGANETTYVYNQGNWYEDVNYAFALGSPYAVKNFFEIEPRLSRDGSSRDAAKQEFSNMVQAADAAGISIMLDAAFNHSSFDAEFGDLGVQLFVPDTSATKTSLVRNFEVRLYSRKDEYDERASYYNPNSDPNNPDTNIALAPDRYDFGKFIDTEDFYFGRYAALVPNSGQSGNYTSEGDWFDYSVGDENSSGSGNGHFDTITQNMWHYFGQYVPYWLSQTGYSGHNSTPADGDYATRLALDRKGLDGLRADFGQGLPPQEWEYIINVARSVKWTMVFMAESLDGGNVGYRSARHFDILNENIIFALKQDPISTSTLRGIYDARRSSYDQALILLNTVSHDEDNYNDPWKAVLRFAANATIDGVPMIFPGQDMGIVTDSNGNNGAGYNFGYDLFERNFGKWIPHFKTYNSMMPLWNNVDPSNQSYNFGNAQLKQVYAGVTQARSFSAALRSSNRYYLDLTGGRGTNQQIYSVAKYELANGSPATHDVVFAFVNLDRSNNGADTFNVNITQNGSNLFGIKSGRTYNVRNISAYLGQDPNRRTYLLWPGGRTGNDVLNNGVFVSLNKVPTANASWSSAPYEAQYLKLYDVTQPTTTPGAATVPDAYSYALDNNASISWTAASADTEGVVPCYRIDYTINNVPQSSIYTCSTSAQISGLAPGEAVVFTIVAVNPNDNSVAGPSSSPTTIHVIASTGDEDGDGMTNAQEDVAGTNPFDPTSVFRVTNITRPSLSTVTLTWSSVSGKKYQVEMASAPNGTYNPVGSQIVASGPSTSETVNGSGSGFYHAKIVP